MRSLQQYQSYQVETASREEGVVMCYDGARRFTDLALAALEGEDYAGVSLNTGKAQRLLEELQGCLDMEASPISKDLWRLYDYWIWRLGQGLLKKDPAAFREVSAVLGEMREAWAEAARQVRAGRAGHVLGT